MGCSDNGKSGNSCVAPVMFIISAGLVGLIVWLSRRGVVDSQVHLRFLDTKDLILGVPLTKSCSTNAYRPSALVFALMCLAFLTFGIGIFACIVGLNSTNEVKPKFDPSKVTTTLDSMEIDYRQIVIN